MYKILPISTKKFKQQAKIIVKNWPLGQYKITLAQNLLAQLYGYKNYHHYQKEIKNNFKNTLSQAVIVSYYIDLVKNLAYLAHINQIQAKKLLHLLWHHYLSPDIQVHHKMYQCQIRFSAGLCDFLSPNQQQIELTYYFDDTPSLKDAVEALGVPHPEVAAVKVNGQWRALFYQLQMNDQIEVYPFPHKHSFAPIKPQGPTRFIIDGHLGTLGRYLRMAGFDCLYPNLPNNEALTVLAEEQERIILTRNIALLKRSTVQYGYWIRSSNPLIQLEEVVHYYQLKSEFKAASRCPRCNGNLKNIDNKITIKDLVPDNVFSYQQDFQQCQSCQQVY